MFQQKGINTKKAGNKSLLTDSNIQSNKAEKSNRIKRGNSTESRKHIVKTKKLYLDLY